MDEVEANQKLQALARSHAEGQLDYHTYRSRRAQLLDELQHTMGIPQQRNPSSNQANAAPPSRENGKLSQTGRWLLLAAVLATGIAMILLAEVS